MRRDAEVWVVRQSVSILLAWFGFSALVLGVTVVWPGFEAYVERVTLDRQRRQLVLALERLDQELAVQLALDPAVDAQPVVVTPQWLTERLSLHGIRLIDFHSEQGVWRAMLEGPPQQVLEQSMVETLSSAGLELQSFSVTSTARQVRVHLAWRVRSPVVWQSRPIEPLAIAAFDTGAIAPCPEGALLGRLGDFLWLSVGEVTGRYRLGTMLSPGWVLVGVRESKPVLKSSIGTLCVMESTT